MAFDPVRKVVVKVFEYSGLNPDVLTNPLAML